MSPATTALRSPLRSLWAVLPASVLALAVCLLQLRVGLHWSGIASYDDGVYVGTASEIVHGVLPYKSFVIVQPPGVPVLLLPITLVCRIFGLGTEDALIAARLETAVVTALCSALAAFALRRRGTVAMLVAGSAMLAFPAASQADMTALIEPYLDLFCLLGIVLLFDGDGHRIARPYLAGLAFGTAFCCKSWALVPILAAVVFCWRLDRTRVWRLIAGLATSVAVVIGPFFVLAPARFVRDVFLSQANRVSLGGSPAARIADLFGLEQLPVAWYWGLLEFLAVAVFVALVVADFRSGNKITPLELFSAVVAGVLIPIFVVVEPFFSHYDYFFAAFAAVLAGCFAVRAHASLQRLSAARLGPRLTPSRRRSAGGTLVAIGIAACGLVLLGSFDHFEKTDYSAQEAPAIAAVKTLPVSACLVSDEVSMPVSANRLTTGSHSCPVVIDALGVALADHKSPPEAATGVRFPQLTAQWESWFSRADDVFLSADFRRRIPWTASLNTWFVTHFHPVSVIPGIGVLYQAQR